MGLTGASNHGGCRRIIVLGRCKTLVQSCCTQLPHEQEVLQNWVLDFLAVMISTICTIVLKGCPKGTMILRSPSDLSTWEARTT